ncbi:MAG: GreA/GreB family elongation factor [Candidatus Velthaea sp.]
MSRAFTKERDDEPEPPIVTRERSHPNFITAAGLEELRRKRAETQDEHERHALDRAIDSAIVTGPPAHDDVVAFGATVVVSGAAPADRTFTIVGEDEADIPAGKIGYGSPLAQALLDARVNDSVAWHRPAGDLTLTVRSITYAPPA